MVAPCVLLNGPSALFVRTLLSVHKNPVHVFTFRGVFLLPLIYHFAISRTVSLIATLVAKVESTEAFNCVS